MYIYIYIYVCIYIYIYTYLSGPPPYARPSFLAGLREHPVNNIRKIKMIFRKTMFRIARK